VRQCRTNRHNQTPLANRRKAVRSQKKKTNKVILFE
jgi:hypothetical protein